MKLKHLALGLVALASIFVSCTKGGDDPMDQKAKVEITGETEFNFDEKANSAEVTFISTRDWEVKGTPEWLSVEPEEGEASVKEQKLTISVTPNDGMTRKATVTINNGTRSKSFNVSQKGTQPDPEAGDGTKEKPYLASQANEVGQALAVGATTSTAVYVRGIVHKIASKHEEGVTKYGNGSFYISDDGAENAKDFYCYQVNYVGNVEFTSVDQVKVGDDVVVYGKITKYGTKEPYTIETEGSGKAYLVSINGQGPEVKDMTIDQAIAAKTGIAAVVGRVIATSKNGFIINDGTQNNMFVPKPESTVAVNDIVKVTGALNDYGKCIRLGDANAHADIIVETSTATVAATPAQTPVVVAQTEFSAFDCGGSAKMVTIAGGTLTSSSDASDPTIKYYNLDYGTGVKPAGSVYTGRNLDSYLDKKLKVTGYFCGKTSNWFMVMETSVEEDGSKSFGVTPTSINVDAAAGSKGKFNVTGEVAWTATASDPAVTLGTASGTGAAEVEVTLAANTAYQKRTFTVTVSTTEDVLVKSYTVTINQAAAVDPSLKVVELTNAEITAVGASIDAAKYQEVTISSASGTWKAVVNASKTMTFLQFRNQQGSYIMSPEFSDNIDKIVLTLTANKNVDQKRVFRAIPTTTALYTDKDKYYDNNLYGTVYAIATDPGSATATAAGEVTLTFTKDTKSFLLTVGQEDLTKSGAAYVDAIKVYLK